MKKTLKFLINAGKLKKMPRTGFLWLGVKNPETIAQHIFRVAIMNWILARKKKSNFNIGKIIKASLVHDLCEVYAGDMTPYWGLLPKDKKKRREFLKKWIRLTKKTKEQRDKKKFKIEKAGLQKLIQYLDPDTKKEVFNCWLDYEKMYSKEGRFVRQGDKVETLLQALEYWGSKPNSPVAGWWEEVRDLVDQPILLDFLVKLERKFYQGKKVDGEVDFMLTIGKLKNMPRRGWIMRKVKNPETIAENSFLVALAVWILGRKKRINLEKALRMSLIYEICEVYAGDMTPYDDCIKINKKTFNSWIRCSVDEKKKRFIRDYRAEKKALQKLLACLPSDIRGKIIGLWDECKKRSTSEGKFVNQVYWLVTYLQAFQYFEKDKSFPILGWYEQMREFIEDPLLLDLMKIMEAKFLPKKTVKSLKLRLK